MNDWYAYLSQYEYFEYLLGESGTDGTEFYRKEESRRKFAGIITALVNDTDLRLECAGAA